MPPEPGVVSKKIGESTKLLRSGTNCRYIDVIKIRVKKSFFCTDSPGRLIG